MITELFYSPILYTKKGSLHEHEVHEHEVHEVHEHEVSGQRTSLFLDPGELKTTLLSRNGPLMRFLLYHHIKDYFSRYAFAEGNYQLEVILMKVAVAGI